MSKWLRFDIWPYDSKKTYTIGVYKKDTGGLLGVIKWYNYWRQYCFFPEGNTIFSKSCLEEINVYIDQLMKERKNVSHKRV
jgi:hypothetical protein